jgi:hypothetical protein
MFQLEDLPRQRTGPSYLRTQPISFLLLGFGLYRTIIGEPQFRQSDLRTAASEARADGRLVPHAANLSKVVRAHVAYEHLRAEASRPGDNGKPTPFAHLELTATGEAYLLDAAIAKMTHQGRRIPDIFTLPQVAQALTIDRRLVNRLVEHVEGTPSGIELPPILEVIPVEAPS